MRTMAIRNNLVILGAAFGVLIALSVSTGEPSGSRSCTLVGVWRS